MLKGREHIYTSDAQAVAITSIGRLGSKIFCGLTGGPKCLAIFDIDTKQFKGDVNIFPWANDTKQIVLRKIHNAMGVMKDGNVIVGEGILYSWDGIPFELRNDHNTEAMQNRRAQSGLQPLQLNAIGPTDMQTFDMRWLKGGKILTWNPQTNETTEICQLPTGQYVQSMVLDAENNKAYGHTIGGTFFFEVFIKEKRLEMHGRISTWAFHNLVVKKGIVYGAWIDFDLENKLRLLRFDPKKGYLERLNQVLLDDPGPRVQGNKGVDQWIVHSSGNVYVGMAGSGTLYQFDDQKLTLSEIGRIGQGGRITSLDEDEKGRILFTGGFPKMSVGRFDPKTGKLEDFGNITDKYQKIYFHGSTYWKGTLYLAETDSGSTSLWEVPLPD